MGSFTDRKTLMRRLKQLWEKVIFDEHYRSSVRGKAGMFWFATSLVRFFFHHDLVAQFGLEQDWSTS